MEARLRLEKHYRWLRENQPNAYQEKLFSRLTGGGPPPGEREPTLEELEARGERVFERLSQVSLARFEEGVRGYLQSREGRMDLEGFGRLARQKGELKAFVRGSLALRLLDRLSIDESREVYRTLLKYRMLDPELRAASNYFIAGSR
ncbi:MAG: hypothetical protein HY558_08270 [Euryarchaeota archaeon]|nr:hypothetical protein [Euryarchaeota archaeon]